MSSIGSLAPRYDPRVRLIPWWTVAILVLVAGSLGCIPQTEDFLDAGNFTGSSSTPITDSLYKGQADYNGHLVFANLPRTVVDDVLPSDLQLATNGSDAMQDVHPIILLYGDQLNGTYLFPGLLPPMSIGTSYNELIILIPFVVRQGGTKWHNYVVRMYLDNNAAVLAGNMYYGYFKEMAAFVETSSSATLADLDVTRSASSVFKWTVDLSASGSFTPSETASTTLANYQHALDIMRMPLLGTIDLVFTDAYVCSFWDWDVTNLEARPIEVTSQFVQPPRSGTSSWVSQGAIVSSGTFAFQLRGLVWRLAYPALPCLF